jgi:hypothetical protein
MGLIIKKGIGTVKKITTPYSPAKEAQVNEENEIVVPAIAEVQEVSEMVDAEIIIKGTNIKLDEVYCRIAFEAPLNGIKLPCRNYFYESQEAFETNLANTIDLNLETSPSPFDVNPPQMQSLEVAHELMKDFFENLGYQVEIIL